MMAGETEIIVTSQDLEVLRDEIIALSKNQGEIYELISDGMKRVGEEWKDEKYVEFETEFRPRMEEILEISERYHEWATKILQPKIDVLKEAEGVVVGSR